MKTIKIPKGNFGWRTIYVPSKKEKRRLQALVPVLMQAEREIAHRKGVDHVAHGFVAGRSPVTCALPHVGYSHTLSLDLKDWFDSVTEEQVANALEGSELTKAQAQALARQITVDGAPRQGLPTSPVACNLAAANLDLAVKDMCDELLAPYAYAYTRYADDLNISFSCRYHIIQVLISRIAAACLRYGWALAGHKTRLQKASSGRRIIVGISVGPDGIRPPRKTKRRLRAARHKSPRSPQARGLAEWCKLRRPKQRRPRRLIQPVPFFPTSPPATPPNGRRRIILPEDV